MPNEPTNDDFKNFHRLLCERFNYVHDELHWKRDQLSLIEHIAAQQSDAAAAKQWQDGYEEAMHDAGLGVFDPEPTHETLCQMAYELEMVPRGEVVCLQFLQMLLKQYKAAYNATRSATDRSTAAAKPPYSAPYTTDVPQCCGDPYTCDDPCHPATVSVAEDARNAKPVLPDTPYVLMDGITYVSKWSEEDQAYRIKRTPAQLAREFTDVAIHAQTISDVRSIVASCADRNARTPYRHVEAQRVLPLFDAFLGEGFTGRAIKLKRAIDAALAADQSGDADA